MNLTFLSAPMPLTKTYERFANGELDSIPYPLTKRFTSHEVEVEDIEDMYGAIQNHARIGHCLLKGNLERSIQNASRAGLAAKGMTNWVCLDFDGYTGAETIEIALNQLGLADVDRIEQYSASQGLKQGLNAHVFMLLTRPMAPGALKLWLTGLNFSIQPLRASLSLTKAKMALHWPLDVTVCQNDKLLYIAPPTFLQMADPLEGQDRISLVRGTRKSFEPTSEKGLDIADATKSMIAQLRAYEGLPARNLSVKYVVQYQCEILRKPDLADVTSYKEGGDFGYVNLNGGDSFGYYFILNRPDLLYNFKDEPVYILKELSPDFYEQALERATVLRIKENTPDPVSVEKQAFVYHSGREDVGVMYDPADRRVKLTRLTSAKQLKDWCYLHGKPVPEYMDWWEAQFIPGSEVVIDPENKIINTYRPSQYWLKRGEYTDVEDIGWYWDLILFVCGGDEKVAEHFVNWLAYIWQTGGKPRTAWVLHGTYGTGKGRLLNVFQHLFEDNCTATSPESLGEVFNQEIETTQILWIDEVTTDAWDNSKVTPKLRNWITEDTIQLRAMYKDRKSAKSFMGIIVAANEFNPVHIQDRDRRWNVAPRQEEPLSSQGWATPEVLDNRRGWLYQPKNLFALAGFLEAYPVDELAVSTPIVTEAKTYVQKMTESAPHGVVQALLEGDIDFFLDRAPDAAEFHLPENMAYKKILSRMVNSNGELNLSLNQIQHLFIYLVGWQKSGIQKFMQAAGRLGLNLHGSQTVINNTSIAGMTFEGFRGSDRHKSQLSAMKTKPNNPLE